MREELMTKDLQELEVKVILLYLEGMILKR